LVQGLSLQVARDLVQGINSIPGITNVLYNNSSVIMLSKIVGEGISDDRDDLFPALLRCFTYCLGVIPYDMKRYAAVQTGECKGDLGYTCNFAFLTVKLVLVLVNLKEDTVAHNTEKVIGIPCCGGAGYFFA